MRRRKTLSGLVGAGEAGPVLAAVLIVALLTAGGCAGRYTTIDKVTRAASIPNAPYGHVLVLGIAPRKEPAAQFERELAAALARSGTRATSMRREYRGRDIDEDLVRDAARNLGADAVLVTRVAKIDTNVPEDREIETERRLEEKKLLDLLRYENEYDELPQEIDISYDVELLTELYDAATGTSVYSILSSSMRSDNALEVILDETEAIVRQLRRDGLVR